MNLTDLPLELLIIIIDYLDIKSKLDLYNAFETMRGYFAPCHLRRLVLSRNTVATAKTLNDGLICSFKSFIQCLDLSGVPDLSLTAAEPFFKTLESLKMLDITFTNIYLSDLVRICPANLQDIAMNFFKKPEKSKRETIWEECRSLFKAKSFRRIHFVVFDFLDSGTPLQFLGNIPKCQNLKLTVADNYRDFWETDDINYVSETLDVMEANFDKLYYLFRDCRVTHKTSICLKGVANLNFKNIEYIFIMYLERIVIYTSSIFKEVFKPSCKDVYVEIAPSLPLDFMLDGNIIFKAWNKYSTKFDKSFFENLNLELKDYFPEYFCTSSSNFMKVCAAPTGWLCIDSCNENCNAAFMEAMRLQEADYRLSDVSPSKLTLTDFCRKDGAVVRCTLSIYQYFQSNTFHNNIRFLRLSNMCFKKKFFKKLFTTCNFLNTLDIYIERDRQKTFTEDWALYLLNSIQFAKKLKNLKLTSEDIDYEMLFEAFSRCPSLENFHICEYERSFDDNEINIKIIEAMIGNCFYLYSIFIEADMSPEYLTLLMSALKSTARNLERDHLCIEVCDCYGGWDQFLDVFNPSPLHILD